MTVERGKTPHSHLFDLALDEQLEHASLQDDRGDLEPDVPYPLVFTVTLRWSENPGWVVDKYGVDFDRGR